MGERLINPIFNVHDKYKEVNIINPYRFAAGGTTLKTGLIDLYNLDEASGTIVNDSVGAYDGSNSNVTVNQTGKIIKSYLFSDNDYIAASTAMLPNSTYLTISAWVKLSSFTDHTAATIINKYGNTSNNAYITVDFLRDAPNANKIRFYTRNSAGTVAKHLISTNTFNDGAWHLIVAVKDADDVYLYVDNNLEASDVGGAAYGTYNLADVGAKQLTIGGNSGNHLQNSFVGNMEQIGIWEAALTSAQRIALWNSGNGLAYSSW